ncbi:phosphopantetheine-binding protein [Bacillus smithii]|uniref:phosphopantetheine-binding protein n=1 Tax=Bacillus smithii TaxID=1479 RepID=UPI003D1CBFCE
MNFEDFRKIISDISDVPLDMIHESSSFRDDLSIDSLQMVHLILELSSKYNIQFHSVQSMDQLSTVGAMFKMLTGSVEH